MAEENKDSSSGLSDKISDTTKSVAQKLKGTFDGNKVPSVMPEDNAGSQQTLDAATEKLKDIFRVMSENRKDELKHLKEIKNKKLDYQKEEDKNHDEIIAVLSGDSGGGSHGGTGSTSSKGSKGGKSGEKKEKQKSSKGSSSVQGKIGQVIGTAAGILTVAGITGGKAAGFGGGGIKKSTDSEAKKTASKEPSGGGSGSGGQVPGDAAGFIAKQEGFPKGGKAYWDPPGQKKLVSVGYGHQIKADEQKAGVIKAGSETIKLQGEQGVDTTVSQAQAVELLKQDLPKYVDAAKRPLGSSWEKLSDSQKSALTSYAYNTGSTASLVKAGIKEPIEKGDTAGAASIIRDKGIRTAGGQENRALVSRRATEAALFQSSKLASVMAPGDSKSATGTPSAAKEQLPSRDAMAASGGASKAAGSLSSVASTQSGVDIAGLKPEFEKRVAAMAAAFQEKTGKKLLITSGFRSNEKQKELWDAKLKENGGNVAATRQKVAEPAAPLGNGRGSMHMAGLAIDINSKGSGGINLLAGSRDNPTGWLESFGLSRPVKGEDWHVQLSGAPVTPDNPANPGAPTLVANKDGAVDLKNNKKESVPSPNKPSQVASASSVPSVPKSADVPAKSTANKDLKDSFASEQPKIVLNNTSSEKTITKNKSSNIAVNDDPIYLRKVIYG